MKYITAMNLWHHRQVGYGKRRKGEGYNEGWGGDDNWSRLNADHHPFRQTPFLGYCNRGYL